MRCSESSANGNHSEHQRSNFAFKAHVEGLRGVAIIGVLAHHFGLGLPGGFSGVDVFFVISGYLITSVVIRDARQGTFTIRSFIERRIRRIAPASGVTLLLTLLMGLLLMQPNDLVQLAKATIASALLASNLYFSSLGTDYFDPNSATRPLLHMWSLSVEEQFYLVFPAIAAFVARRPLIQVRRFVWFGALVSAAIATAFSILNPIAGFYWPFCRAWELLAGVLLALRATESRPKSATRWTSWVGLGFVVAAYAVPARSPQWELLGAFAGCVGAALCIVNGGSALLEFRPIRWIGRISYSLYLLHWPIAAFAAYVSPDLQPAAVNAFGIVVSVALAATFRRFVELPFQRAPWARTPVMTWILFFALTSSVVGAAYAILAAKGLPDRHVVKVVGDVERPTRKFVRPLKPGAPLSGLATFGKPRESGVDVALFGDSHGMAVSQVVADAAEQRGLSCVAALRARTVPLLGAWLALDCDASIAWTEGCWRTFEESKIKDLVVVARWSSRIYPDTRNPDYFITDAIETGDTPEAAARVLRRALRMTLQRAASSGFRVWIVLEPPLQRFNPAQIAIRAAYLGIDPATLGTTRQSHDGRNALVREVILSEAHDFGATVVDLSTEMYEQSEIAPPARLGLSYYYDENHLAPAGAERWATRAVSDLMRLISETPISTR